MWGSDIGGVPTIGTVFFDMIQICSGKMRGKCEMLPEQQNNLEGKDSFLIALRLIDAEIIGRGF